MSRRLYLLLVLCGALMGPSPVIAEDDQARVGREMIQALEAYAVYKMGDYELAYSRYLALAEAGNRQGMLNVANMHALGQGVPMDHALAFQWYLRAAEAGDPIAQYEVGKAYDLGQGVGEDLDLAQHWYERAAEGNNPDALWELGKRDYDHERLETGLVLIRRAAEAGQPTARLFLHQLEAEASHGP
ncbi:hypothetical protein CK507_06920 [Pseudomonas sp. WN033]|nr:hypothetical protein CK507_06920 [Pseudomonas sp. WN033]